MSTKPNFLHLPTGQIVFPEGYEPEELEPLPADYWLKREVEDAITAIKMEAARQIEKISPWWRQNNDIRNPTPEGTARFAAIDAIREKSNEDEANLLKGLNNG